MAKFYKTCHKLRAIFMVESGKSKRRVAARYKIQRSQLNRWIRSKNKLNNTRSKSLRVRSSNLEGCVKSYIII